MEKSVDGELKEIREPRYTKEVSNKQLLMGNYVTPIDRLKVISEDEFEELIEEWIYGYLMSEYEEVKKIDKVIRLAGSGDKGRDVVAFEKYTKDGKELWDNYQCKHYNGPLAPSQVWVEFGKVCYYTYKGDYSVPQNYYFVSPQGVGTSLADLLMKPEELKKGLIKNWDRHCLNKISKEKVELTGDFKNYVEQFNFSIFDSINPGELINQYQQTKYFPFRFGGGLIENPKRIGKPSEIKKDEQLYVRKLYDAYSQRKREKITSLSRLRKYKLLFQHFQRQRTYFYQAESLRVFERDTMPNGLNAFEELKEQVYHGIIDTIYEEYEDGYERVKATTEKAKTLILASDNILIDFVNVQDRMGICHHLANEKSKEPDEAQVIWVIDDE
ncbi:ABC-three component system protein [Virgibacillus dakarensis]|uniref:ABC-three component system protein n=1 Tax=Virgibacillus dakarensis TaxID=1917889 RepID=UPI000B44EF1C|nr:ABC-three component system protein [Virgibacillus dakarensis]